MIIRNDIESGIQEIVETTKAAFATLAIGRHTEHDQWFGFRDLPVLTLSRGAVR